MHIATTDTTRIFEPASFKERGFRFIMKELTPAEMDEVGYELFRQNIVEISAETFRSIVIDELFTFYPEDKAEEHAQLLDEFFLDADKFNEELQQWSLQERQRLLDIELGATPAPKEPMPQHMMRPRQRAQANILFNEIRERSARVREKTIEKERFPAKHRAAMMRLIITGWSGLKTTFVKENGIIPEDVFNAMRAEIGPDAYTTLSNWVGSNGVLTEEERGNFGSPPDTGSDPMPSPEQSGASEIRDGASTASSTEPTRPGESEAGIEQSSTSTSQPVTETVSAESIQTAAE